LEARENKFVVATENAIFKNFYEIRKVGILNNIWEGNAKLKCEVECRSPVKNVTTWEEMFYSSDFIFCPVKVTAQKGKMGHGP
jgi:hypothetical protein